MKSRRELPKKSLKIGLVQMTSIDDVKANVAMVHSALKDLRGQGCDLICFPENALYLKIDKKIDFTGAQNLKENYWREFQDYARTENCALMFGSVAFKSGKKNVNATVIVEPGKKPKVIYEKIHLFDVDVSGAPASRESDYFSAGKKTKVFKFRGWNIGLSICYDVRFAELYAKYAKANVHLLLVPAAFLVPTGNAHWHVLLRARAIESQAFLVAAAQCGGHKGLTGGTRETYGHSLVVGPWGEVQADLGGAGANAEIFVLEPANLLKVRTQIPMAQHRRL